ncbi:uncharacterized protein [Macrobrachium rosenbergii]|uniref:uncharacterized protein isoform X2 n=1 Tax=Macrobrachium rosenbergii TaxID=79674 RepID=UPI0034D525B8
MVFVFSKVSSAVKKSPNRIHCQPLSPQRSRRKSTPGSPRITPNSPRTLQREEKSPESLREITGFSSPKLPSATDSMDNAMRNINCIFDGEKSGLSPPHAEAMPVTSTLVSSPAREHLNSPRANFTVKPNLKDDISPILAPASGSNVLVQPEDDINPQPGCSKWFSGNGDGTKENLHLNGASKESLSLHIQKPKDFVAATRNSSFESLLPLSPIQESSSEECGVDLPLDLPSPSAHQSPCDSAIQEPSKSKSEKDTDGEELPKLKELRAGTREELFEAETSTPEPKNTEKIGEIGTYRLKGTPTRQDFKGANSVKLGKKTTWKEPCVAITSQSGRETNREKFLEPNAVQVMRQMEEELTRQDSNKSKNKMTRCNGKELKEYHPVKKIPRLTTDFSQKAFYSTICDVKDSSEGVMYRVPGLVMQIGISSNQPCTAEECLQGICFHDWIWGLCTACGTQFESWELRENYSVEDFKSKFLPCITCSKDKPSTSCQTPRKGSKTRYSSPIRKSPRTKTGPLNQEKGLVRASHKSRDDEKSIGSASESCSIVPYICSWLILEDPEDDSNILVHVAGEDAKIFYGAEPTFEWLTGTPDNHIRRLVSVLLKQRAPLWYGVQKYTSENSGHYFLIRHTQIISGKYKDSV